MKSIKYFCFNDIKIREKFETTSRKWIESRLKLDCQNIQLDDGRLRDRLRSSLWFRSYQFSKRTSYKTGIGFIIYIEDPNNPIVRTYKR